MTYRSAIESRARQAADAARTEVLITELRLLEHELPMARADRWAGEGEAEDMERAVRWLRRTLKMPVSPEERREQARERARRRRESKRPPTPESSLSSRRCRMPTSAALDEGRVGPEMSRQPR